jgi:CubicO group peptidase (beta-lactamase class C family)
MQKKSIVFIGLLCICLTVKAQKHQQYKTPIYTDSNRIEKIKAQQLMVDELYQKFVDRVHSPGLVYGIVLGDSLILKGAKGLTNVSNKTEVNTKSVFRIASMSKSFTAMAILKLRDEGKLQLEDPAWKYIPEMKKVKYLTSDAPAITIRNLITHTTGFPEDNPWGDRQLSDTDKELIDLVKQGISFSNVPGLTYEYSNLAFSLAGYIITQVSGMPYQKYITQNILKPLGMNHTYWEYNDVPKSLLAHGYRWTNNSWVEEPLLHDGAYGAMGGMLTSLEDFAKYVSFHLSAWPANNKKETGPIKRSSLREMHQFEIIGNVNGNYKYSNGKHCAVVNGYGYGLRITKDCEGKTWSGHTGGLPGFGSNWQILPEYGLGIISFSNVTYSPTSSMNTKVWDTLLQITQLKPYQIQVSQILKQRQSEIVALLPQWKNAEASNIFADNFFLDYDKEKLISNAKDIFEKAGKLITVTELKPENQLRGTFIMEFENQNIQIFFTLTPEANPKIQEFSMRKVSK